MSTAAASEDQQEQQSSSPSSAVSAQYFHGVNIDHQDWLKKIQPYRPTDVILDGLRDIRRAGEALRAVTALLGDEVEKRGQYYTSEEDDKEYQSFLKACLDEEPVADAVISFFAQANSISLLEGHITQNSAAASTSGGEQNNNNNHNVSESQKKPPSPEIARAARTAFVSVATAVFVRVGVTASSLFSKSVLLPQILLSCIEEDGDVFPEYRKEHWKEHWPKFEEEEKKEKEKKQEGQEKEKQAETQQENTIENANEKEAKEEEEEKPEQEGWEDGVEEEATKTESSKKKNKKKSSGFGTQHSDSHHIQLVKMKKETIAGNKEKEAAIPMCEVSYSVIACFCLGTTVGEGAAQVRDLFLQYDGMEILTRKVQAAVKREKELVQRQKMEEESAEESNELLLVGYFLRFGVWSIAQLCRNKPHPQWDSISPCIRVLADLLDDPNDHIRVDALWIASYLTDRSTIDRGVLAIALPSVLQRLRDGHKSDAALPCLRLIGNIFAANDQELEKLLFSMHFLPRLQSFMLPKASRQIRKEVCWLFSNILCCSLGSEAIVSAGLLPLAVANINSVEFEVRREATWIIANGVVSNDPDHCLVFTRAAVQAGALQVLCQVLHTMDSRICSISLEALEAMLTIEQGHIPESGNWENTPDYEMEEDEKLSPASASVTSAASSLTTTSTATASTSPPPAATSTSTSAGEEKEDEKKKEETEEQKEQKKLREEEKEKRKKLSPWCRIIFDCGGYEAMGKLRDHISHTVFIRSTQILQRFFDVFEEFGEALGDEEYDEEGNPLPATQKQQQGGFGGGNWNQQQGGTWKQQPAQGGGSWGQQPAQGGGTWGQQPAQGGGSWGQQPAQGGGTWKQQPAQGGGNWNQQPQPQPGQQDQQPSGPSSAP